MPSPDRDVADLDTVCRSATDNHSPGTGAVITPQFPADLVVRLAQAMEPAADGAPAYFRESVFCLLKISLLPDLRAFVANGGRKIGACTAQQNTVQVPFDEPGAFANANTLAQLQALQK